MSRQDKATTERHARTLRELVKRPDNKFCADCKRNDARWASWNIGVFVCIRCSGIHRSMGTHISKVKSVDLDTWTPEQMASVMKWGNARANTYWEAHLKPGHVPADHKIESFIRSKYDSRRWAMEGPPPEDPSVLDGVGSAGDAEQEAPAPPPAASSSRPPAVTPAQAAAPVRSGGVAISPAAQQTARQLLSTGVAGRTIPQAAQPAAPPAQAAPAPATAAEDIFSLDFHAPASAAPTSPGAGAPKKDVKQDILSLFSSAPAAAPAPSSAFGQFGAAPPAQGSPWDAFGAPAQAAPVPAQQSMMGGSGAGMWGVNSGWNAPAAPAAPAQPNIWGSAVPATAAPGMFNTNDVWASPAQSAGAPAASGAGSADLFSSLAASGSASTQKKDDAFGDIWGGFK